MYVVRKMYKIVFGWSANKTGKIVFYRQVAHFLITVLPTESVQHLNQLEKVVLKRRTFSVSSAVNMRHLKNKRSCKVCSSGLSQLVYHLPILGCGQELLWLADYFPS